MANEPQVATFTPDKENPGWGTDPKSGVDPWDLNTEEALIAQARRAEDVELQRYEEGKGILSQAFQESRTKLNTDIDANLLFSRASDSVGAQSKRNIESLRRSLGGRGLRASSGAAQGMLSRIAFQKEGALTGATRDIAIENQRQRQVNAAVNFANALNLANFTNAPHPQAGLDVLANLTDLKLAREGLRSQERSAARAGKKNWLSAAFGAIPVVGGIFEEILR